MLNQVTVEILQAIARKCIRDATSAYAASSKTISDRQQAMLLGKAKQANQIYDFIRERYPDTNLPTLTETRMLSGK